MEGDLEKYGQPLENGGRFREIWPTLRKTSETTKRVTNQWQFRKYERTRKYRRTEKTKDIWRGIRDRRDETKNEKIIWERK